MSDFEARHRAAIERLTVAFRHYAETCLKIRTKDGSIQPLTLNAAQIYLHGRLQAQIERTGKVRALVLKGRQQGISTYIGGRFYWKSSLNRGKRVFILTHQQDATDNLFGMVDRYHSHCPTLAKPVTGAANAKELYFSKMESGYAVATAGTKAVGRSQTVQMFHGCLSPDTFIIDGQTGHLRRMGDFAIGDQVRTHTGAVARVSFISRQHKPALSVTLKGMGQMPLVATAEHRFFTENGWKVLSDIAEGETLLFPVAAITNNLIAWDFRLPDAIRPQGGGTRESGPDTIVPSYELGRVLGLYLAEGCIIKQSKSGEPAAVTFAVHEREVERTRQWLDQIDGLFRSYKVAPRAGSKTVTLTVYGRSFANFVRNVCGERDGKMLPAQWRDCGESFARGMVHGYLSGDGHSSKRKYDRRISAPSIRSAISIGMRDALASLGYGWACVGYHPGRSRYGKICKPLWTLRLCGDGVDRLCAELGWHMPPRKRRNLTGVQVRDGFARVPIVKIEPAGEVEVMDFEIDHSDHSYCTVHAATHNSEVAFWPNAKDHFAGVVQAVPDMPGTEIILESTANGIGGEFHDRWQNAEAGKGDYEAIFIPWHWESAYRRELEPDFVLNDEETEYMRLHGLDHQQMAWRRAKLEELGDPLLFMQEYPAVAAEAFQSTGHDSYIKPEHVLRARKAKLEGIGPLIIGVDPARFGDDGFSIAWRKGRQVSKVERRYKLDNVAGANWVRQIIDNEKPQKVFIDAGGVGSGVVDILKSWGDPYDEIVVGVNFGSAPRTPPEILPDGTPKPGPRNRRAEMWMMSLDWLKDEGGADIPDLDWLQGDACGPAYSYDVNQRLLLEPKEKMRARGLRSPDGWDSIALTFAEPVAFRDPDRDQDRTPFYGAGGWMG